MSHCDTIFLFQHVFTLPFIAMFNFMDDSKFMTILHQCFFQVRLSTIIIIKTVKYYDFVFLKLIQSYFQRLHIDIYFQLVICRRCMRLFFVNFS